jgi:hypothetical protein
MIVDVLAGPVIGSVTLGVYPCPYDAYTDDTDTTVLPKKKSGPCRTFKPADTSLCVLEKISALVFVGTSPAIRQLSNSD